jgi:hypothetical protein
LTLTATGAHVAVAVAVNDQVNVKVNDYGEDRESSAWGVGGPGAVTTVLGLGGEDPNVL